MVVHGTVVRESPQRGRDSRTTVVVKRSYHFTWAIRRIAENKNKKGGFKGRAGRRANDIYGPKGNKEELFS